MHKRMDGRTDKPKAICPLNFVKVGGIKKILYLLCKEYTVNNIFILKEGLIFCYCFSSGSSLFYPAEQEYEAISWPEREHDADIV